MSASQSSSTGNRILAAIDAPEYQHFVSQLERVSLRQEDVIYKLDSKIEYVYFPETTVFSMLATMENGSTVEVGPVGREGMLGLNIFFDSNISSTHVIVHIAGTAMRTKAEILRQEIHSGKSMMPHLLKLYARMLLAITGQGSACNKLHSLEQQLARWLLMMHDYVGDELLLTHDLIALTLGVRRAGVTAAAINLKNAGLIAYRRGHVTILDRRGLKVKACECYKEIKAEYNLLYASLSDSSS